MKHPRFSAYGMAALALVTLACADEPAIEMARDQALNCDAFFLALHDEARPVDEIRDASRRTLLHLAAQAHNQQNVFILLQRGANPSARDAFGATPLHDAVATKGDDSRWVWEMLCLRGADVNAVTEDGATPLTIAIERNNRRAVEFLLWLGAEIVPKGVPAPRLPRTVAAARGMAEIVSLLDAATSSEAVSRFATPRQVPEYLKRELVAAAHQGDLQRLETLLESGVPIDSQDETGRTALHRAASANQVSVITFLLFLGANPNIQTNDGGSPLSILTGWLGFSYDQMRSMLVLAGGDLNLEMKDGFSPLSLGAREGNGETLRLAFWSGLDPNQPTRKGSLMHLASRNSRQYVIDLLRSYGVTEPPFTGDTPEWRYFDAVKRGDVAEAARQLDRGVPIDTAEESGSSALMLAIGWNEWGTANLLLERGADVNYVNPKTGWTPLFTTAIWNSPPATALREKLLKTGAGPNVRARDGLTPLIRTIPPVGTNASIEQFVRYGADVNAADGKGRTPLGIAGEFKNEEAARILIRLGATR
jgi:ankyrin repeat protein